MTLPFAQGASDAKLKPAPSPILAVSDSFTSAAPPTLQNLTHHKPTGGGMMDQSKLYKTHSSSYSTCLFDALYSMFSGSDRDDIERSEIAKMMNKKYRMGSDGNTAQRRGCVLSLPVLVTDQPQPQTVFAQIQNTPLPALLISFSSLGIKTSNRYKHVYVPGVSRFVLFPISSPNHGVLWQLLAHLRDSLSIICHHQSAVVQRRTGQIQSQQQIKILYLVFTM